MAAMTQTKDDCGLTGLLLFLVSGTSFGLVYCFVFTPDRFISLCLGLMAITTTTTTMMMMTYVGDFGISNLIYSTISSFLEFVELGRSNNSARSDSEKDCILSNPRQAESSQKRWSLVLFNRSHPRCICFEGGRFPKMLVSQGIHFSFAICVTRSFVPQKKRL